MKLDRSKKYEGLGLTWEFCDQRWRGKNTRRGTIVEAFDEAMAWWLDAGHIKPVRETKIVRMENVSFTKLNDKIEMWDWRALSQIPDGAQSNPVTLEFEVEA